MNSMKLDSVKRLVLLFSGTALCFGVSLGAADLSSVRNVYLLKMPKGLDQYLANHITSGHVFQVVTDPKLADTILTDQIGEKFQAKLDELYPPPEVEKPAKPEKEEKEEKAGKDESNNPLGGDTVNKLVTPVSSFGQAKGVIFLVDAKSKQVIWSAYDVPKDSSSKALDRTASNIVSRIKHDLGKK
jgi:hypothetical protein